MENLDFLFEDTINEDLLKNDKKKKVKMNPKVRTALRKRRRAIQKKYNSKVAKVVMDPAESGKADIGDIDDKLNYIENTGLDPNTGIKIYSKKKDKKENLSELFDAAIEENLSEKLKKLIESLKNENTKIFILEFDDGKFLEHFEDEDIDFSKFKYYNRTKEEIENGRPVFTFVLTGGQNGSGKWEDYLNDLTTVFKAINEKLGLHGIIYKLETDIADDVWTAEVLLYKNRESVLTESYDPENPEVTRISDIINEIKDIKYGFISKLDGSRIDDREWIHNCNELGKFYSVSTNPELTIKNKLGICQDQSLAIEYLFKKYHPEDNVVLYALMKSPKGHCVPTYCHDDKWYYLENAWDKEQGLHGPFDTQADLEDYLNYIYYKNHRLDTPEDSPVIVKKYSDYLNDRQLNESVGFRIELRGN